MNTIALWKRWALPAHGAGLSCTSELILIRLRLDGDLMDGAVSSAELDTREQAAVALGEATRVWLSGDLLIELGSDLAVAVAL